MTCACKIWGVAKATTSPTLHKVGGAIQNFIPGIAMCCRGDGGGARKGTFNFRGGGVECKKEWILTP